MRLDGEISSEEEGKIEEKEVNSVAYPIGGGGPQPQKLVVGYALTSKKKKSFLKPKFISLARYLACCLVFFHLFYHTRINIIVGACKFIWSILLQFPAMDCQRTVFSFSFDCFRCAKAAFAEVGGDTCSVFVDGGGVILYLGYHCREPKPTLIRFLVSDISWSFLRSNLNENIPPYMPFGLVLTRIQSQILIHFLYSQIKLY